MIVGSISSSGERMTNPKLMRLAQGSHLLPICGRLSILIREYTPAPRITLSGNNGLLSLWSTSARALQMRVSSHQPFMLGVC